MTTTARKGKPGKRASTARAPLPSRLPPDLIHYVCQTGGGGVSLVIGAGTSMEAPTSLESSATYTVAAHTELVAQGIIAAGACARPDDLSQVADAVVAATGSQLDLINRLPRDRFKTARANRGHLVAVASLLEGAIKAVITLNYDGSLISAVTDLGAGDRVGIIEGPEDGGDLKMVNVFFLHRSAHRPGEQWIVQSVALEEGWKNGWEALVAAQIGGSPCVLFAGLGTPVPVLLSTVERVRNAYPGQRDRIFLAGPGQVEDSDFATALNLVAANYIQRKWCPLMDELGRHMASLMCDGLLDAAKLIEQQRGYAAGTISTTCIELRELDLVDLGHLRSAWLLSSQPYQLDVPGERPLLADLLLGIAQIEDVAGVVAGFGPSGILTLAKASSTEKDRPATLAVACGSGHLNWLTLEAQLTSRLGHLMAGIPRPRRALVSAVQGGRVTPPLPNDIVRDIEPESILFDPPLELVDLEELRANPHLAEELVA